MSTVNLRPRRPLSTPGSYRKITGTTIESYYNHGGALGPTEYYTRSGNALSLSTISAGSSTPVVITKDDIVQLTATDLTFQSKSPAS
jgi:hypothetical protein